jgi:hypothetical protein
MLPTSVCNTTVNGFKGTMNLKLLYPRKHSSITEGLSHITLSSTETFSKTIVLQYLYDKLPLVNMTAIGVLLRISIYTLPWHSLLSKSHTVSQHTSMEFYLRLRKVRKYHANYHKTQKSSISLHADLTNQISPKLLKKYWKYMTKLT